MSGKVYLAIAEYMYEGFEVMRVYALEQDALTFVQRCNEYINTKPNAPPPIEDTPENDEAHRKWWKKEKKWQIAHPAKPYECEGAGHFAVRAVEFFPAPKQ